MSGMEAFERKNKQTRLALDGIKDIQTIVREEGQIINGSNLLIWKILGSFHPHDYQSDQGSKLLNHGLSL